MQKITVQALSDDQYLDYCSKVHDVYKKSNGQTLNYLAFEHLKPILEKMAGKPIDFLSVGPADGERENLIFKGTNLKVNSFYGVEPMEAYVAPLTTRANSWNIPNVFIDPQEFTVDFQLAPGKGEKFDFIFMSHILYHCPDPVAIINKAVTYLKDDGMLLVITATSDDLFHKVWRHFYKFYEPEWLNGKKPLCYHHFGHQDIVDGVLDNGLKCETTINNVNFHPRFVDKDILSFILQFDVDKIDEGARQELLKYVDILDKENATRTDEAFMEIRRKTI